MEEEALSNEKRVDTVLEKASRVIEEETAQQEMKPHPVLKRKSLAAKNVDIPPHVERKMTGDNSSKKDKIIKKMLPTLVKKDGLEDRKNDKSHLINDANVTSKTLLLNIRLEKYQNEESMPFLGILSSFYTVNLQTHQPIEIS